MNESTILTPEQARESLDSHLREIISWHFSRETGTPFWLDYAKQADWDPRRDVRCIDDLKLFQHFDDELLRSEPHARWIPKAYENRPYFIFETGGTTGMPKQRLSWQDHLTDYTEFSQQLDDSYFPKGGNWLMLGPTGPRRLRLSIEHIAQLRGGSCYFVDLDPRYVKKLLARRKQDEVRRYMKHVIDQAVEIITHRDVPCLFATPRLLEALGERLSLPEHGIRGVFCGGTSMTPQVIRFLCEEVLEGQGQLVPTYGNTLMGLARGKPVGPDDGWALTYYAPQPRAVLRVVDPQNTDKTVKYDQWGRVELSTLTRELFMPRLLERDEALRREPTEIFAWDGVGDVRPFGAIDGQTVAEGVY